MKALFFGACALLIGAGPVMAQSSPANAPALPPAAAKLKADYEAGVEKVAPPIRQRYVSALNGLIDQLTRAGKVDEAVAVKAEADSLAAGKLAADDPGAIVESAPVLPSSASSLKQTYGADLSRATQSIRQRYLSDLKSLFDQATRAGKLEDALAIKAESDAVVAEGQSAANPIRFFEKRLVGTRWNWTNNSVEITFERNGAIQTPAGAAWAFTWKAVAPYEIKYRFSNGNGGTINFNRALSEARIEETLNTGKKQTLKLLRIK